LELGELNCLNKKLYRATVLEKIIGIFSTYQKLKNLGYNPDIKYEEIEVDEKKHTVKYHKYNRKNVFGMYGYDLRWEGDLKCIYVDRLVFDKISTEAKYIVLYHEIGHALDQKYDGITEREVTAEKNAIDTMKLTGSKYKSLTNELYRRCGCKKGRRIIKKNKCPNASIKIAYQYACEKYGK